MKRCPKCSREYDNSMMFCLDDGAELLYGPASIVGDEPATARLGSGNRISNEQATKTLSQYPTTGPVSFDRPVHTASNKNSLIAGLVGIILITALGIGSYLYYGRSSNKQIESVAVMPFTNDSGNAEVDYLSDGMAETLIKSLSQIPNLAVKSRSTVFSYKGKETSPKKIGEELNVQAVLLGRVAQHGDDLKLSLELVSTTSQNIIWAEEYDRKRSDLVSLQSEIARDVSSKLKSKLSGADVAKVEKTYTANPEAYQLYLKGKFFWNKRTGESLKRAVEYYNQAVEKDPNYALAYSGLAETYVLFSSYDIASAGESMPQARASAERALAIDDSLAEPHNALGFYLDNFEWDRAGSEREFRRAIELNPNYATAHHWLSSTLSNTRRFDESIAELERAQELDPVSPIIGTNFGDTLCYAHRFDDAIAQYKRVLNVNPDFGYAHQALGAAYGFKRMFPEAIAETRRGLELRGDTNGKGYLALWLARSGKRDEAMKILSELQQQAASGAYVQAYTFALVYIGLDDREQALSYLDKHMANRAETASTYAVAPELDDLRSNPRFEAMLKKMNLPE